MSRFLVRRLLLAIPTLIGVTLIVFVLIQITPGDPAELMLGPMATDESVADLRDTLGLEKPVLEQYGLWIGRIAKGDFGRSFTFRRDVSDELFDKAGATAVLVLAAMTIAAVGGITLGVISGLRPNSWADRVSRILSSLGVSMPEFFLGIMLILFLAGTWNLFPASGIRPPGQTEFRLLDLLRHLVLPATTLAVPQLAIIARLTRSNVLSVMQQDYVRTGRAKGLPGRLLFRRHVLRNMLIPIVTVLGWQLGYLLGATVLVEVVFGWPGLGQLAVTAANSRDYPLLQAITLVIAFVVVFVNIIVDASYPLIDPRVRAR
jgi:peptide/nickel transport system permease protein